MKRTTYFVLLLVTAFAALATERYAPATGSFVRIEGTSTLHEWKMEGSTIKGTVNVTNADSRSAEVAVVIPVTSIKSEHDRMDRLMADALKARTNPDIRYELTTSQLQSSSAEAFVVRTTGKLTIAGVTRDIGMDISVTRDGNGYVLTGQAPIRMTDFEVKPPTAMMNTIRTGNDVKVTFRWVVAPSN